MQDKSEYKEFNEEWLQRNNVQIDWEIIESNYQWHKTYFTRPAVKDHQAKGNCRLAWLVVEELEQQGWIKKGDVILDPMCGIGSFLIVASLKGYPAVGVELEKRFYDDMIGYTKQGLETNNPDDLLDGFVSSYHVPGNIEEYRKKTKDIPVGSIKVVQGDARNLRQLFHGDAFNGSVICSPPYGNRLADDAQIVGANDGTDWKAREGLTTERQQYSSDDKNIGTNRIAIVSSPPYSSSTEIGGKAVDPDKKSYFQRMQQKGAVYNNGNLARAPLGVICSPPYSRETEHDDSQIDALSPAKQHGHKAFMYTDKDNIAVLKIGDYDREMLKVYRELFASVPDRTPIALITRNFIKRGKIVLLDELTVGLMEQAGFTYKFTKRGNLPDISMFKYMNWSKAHRQKNLPLITWEEVTFYRKENV